MPLDVIVDDALKAMNVPRVISSLQKQDLKDFAQAPCAGADVHEVDGY
jgi:hypothetical protein